MNKHSVRSFIFGIIFATSIIAVYYYFFDTNEFTTHKEVSLDTTTAKNYLLNENYVVMTKQELNDSKEEAVQAAISSLLDETENTKKDTSTFVESVTYSLSVKPGMSATAIAKLLAQNGIVENETEFLQYLTINGFSKKIRVNTYEVNSEMTFEEIATTITSIPE